MAPFASMALIYVICYPIFGAQLRRAAEARRLTEETHNTVNSDRKSNKSTEPRQYEPVRFVRLIKEPRFVFGLFS